MSNFKMDDYVTVPERIDKFKAQFPDGSLQSEIVELTAERVTVKAYAYRTLDDPRPGIGHSSLEIPGGTPFTRGSEIENAETSAWGRAIAALGFEVKRGIASAEEARNKQPERSRGPARAASTPSGSAPAQRTPEEQTLLGMIEAAAGEHGISHAALSFIADGVGVPKGQHANAEQLTAILARIESPSSGVPNASDGQGAEVARPSAPNSDAASEGTPETGSGSATAPEVDPPLPPGPAHSRTVEEAIADAEAKAKTKVPA